jgi:xanthine dehydrogenase YagS FAD-binding subunit
MLKPFSYKRAATLAEAIAEAGRPGAAVLAGGTDLLGCLRDGVMDRQALVSLSGLKQLKGIGELPNGGLRIGALATLAEIAAHPRIRKEYAALAEAAASVGTPQLRNQGTLGGNLCQRPRCWYFRGDFRCLRKGGDTCFAMTGENQYHCVLGGDRCLAVHPSDTAPALVALEARLRIAGPAGARTAPIGSFFLLPKQSVTAENVLKPGEVITEVLLDPGPARSTYRKVRERGAWDFALAGAAVALHMAAGKVVKARIVLSGAAPAPWRSVEAEKALEGGAAPEAAAAAALKDAVALDQNGYKVPLLRGVVEEAIRALKA